MRWTCEQEFSESASKNSAQALRVSQLLRSGFEGIQEAGQIG